MSNLSDFIGVGGGIKSVQKGTTNLIAPDSSADVTINAVNTNKSFISLNGIDTTNTGVLPCGTVELLNSTTVRVVGRRTTGTSVTIIISWTVVEYY